MNKKEEFLKDVMHEINMLKQHATKEEKKNLNFDSFNPITPKQCIYGQMTGNCYTKRAKELMDLSCIKVMDLEEGVREIEDVSIEDEAFAINGKYTGQAWRGDAGTYYDRNYKHLSALEGYICTKNAKTEEILSYIKGEINTLSL